MSDDDVPDGFSLKRWSRRKHEAARAASATPGPPAASETASTALAPAAGAVPPAPPPAGHDATAGAIPAPLPPVDSLVFDSDFTQFLQPKVDETVKRQALKKLFQDPRFNVMDRLDVYIDDYSLPDPISPEVVRELLHMRSFFSPPKTRVNAQGFVEDVPADEAVPPPPASALPAPDGAVPPAPAPETDVAPVRPAAADDEGPVQRDNEQPKP